MKVGRSLEEVAAEVIRQNDVKVDYIADTRSIPMVIQDGIASMHMQYKDPENNVDIDKLLGITDLCHGQIASTVKIPKPYYDRMRTEQPTLLATNVNRWFSETPLRRMVRTLDDNARALRSDNYRPLDNYDLAEAVLPIIQGTDGISVVSTEITETRFYIKAVNERLEGEVRKGDPVQAGVLVRNSEVGHGSLAIEPLLYRLVCLNGMVLNDYSMRKFHVGRKNGGGDDASNVWEYLSDETRKVTDQSVWMKVKDLTAAALEQAMFDNVLADMKEVAEEQITGSPVKAVQLLTKQSHQLSDFDGESVLLQLVNGGDMSRWGLANAVTAHSQDVDDYDKATALETLGGHIMQMKPQEWGAIAQAA